jgi:hypothetical protein
MANIECQRRARVTRGLRCSRASAPATHGPTTGTRPHRPLPSSGSHRPVRHHRPIRPRDDRRRHQYQTWPPVTEPTGDNSRSRSAASSMRPDSPASNRSPDRQMAADAGSLQVSLRSSRAARFARRRRPLRAAASSRPRARLSAAPHTDLPESQRLMRPAHD